MEAVELKKKHKVDANGELTVKISNSSFWTNLESVTNSKTPALFFTAYGINSLCDNWSQEVYDDLGGHVYPAKTDDTYAYIPQRNKI